MKTTNPLLKKLLLIILYEPELLNDFIKLNNRGYIIRLIYQLLPTRFGIEIDSDGYDRDVASELFDLKDKNKDFEYSHTGFSPSYIGSCSELRFSIWNHKHFVTLKKALDLLFVCEDIFPLDNGGLHIHINVNDRNKPYSFKRETNRKEIEKQLSHYFNYIQDTIFSSSKERKSRKFRESSRIAIFRNWSTIEYRMGDPTFNYTTIVKQVLCCEQINKSICRNHKLRLDICDLILSL